MSVEKRLIKHGGSLHIIIPKHIVEEFGVGEGDLALLELINHGDGISKYVKLTFKREDRSG